MIVCHHFTFDFLDFVPNDIKLQCIHPFRHYLHIYFCTVDLLSYRFDDSNDNILETFSFRIVMQNESFPLLRISASKGRGPHTRVNSSKVVMQSIQILEEEIKNLYKAFA